MKPQTERTFERCLDAIDSMTKLDAPPSGKSVVSVKHKPSKIAQLNGGQHATYKFENGYGDSVINSGMAYGGLELAVLDKTGRIDYTTPITRDVKGHLDAESLEILLDRIAALPAVAE